MKFCKNTLLKWGKFPFKTAICCISTVIIQGLFPVFSFAQGSTCANANLIQFDGVCRNFNAAGATSTPMYCNTNGPDNTTYFYFPSSATSYCPNVTIQTIPATEFEIGVFAGNCNNGGANYANSMCVFDGDAVWSPMLTFSDLQPGTNYYLRIRVKGNFSGGVIKICAVSSATTNDNCATAQTVGTAWLWSNNFCSTPGPGITANHVCGTTLENTKWFVATIDIAGPAIFNLKNIDCDQGSGLDGYQIGFFTGSCSGLQPLFCSTSQADGDDFLQYTTPSYPAGTKIYMAMDGNAGANCQLEINGFNVMSLLSIYPRPAQQQNQPLYKISGRTIYVNPREPVLFQLYDNMGRLIDNRKISSATAVTYAAGLYHMRMNNKTHTVWLR